MLGVQPDGLQVFTPHGHAVCFPAWSINRVPQPWMARRGIYRGLLAGDVTM